MAVLTNKSIASTYKSVLSIGATTESALTSSIQQLTDGLGNGSPLSMSTTQIQFNAGSNTFKFPTTRGTSGQILKLADANGTLGWVADASGDVTKTDPIALNTIAVWNDSVDELRSDATMSINASHNISLLQTNSNDDNVNSYNIGGGNIANVTGSNNVGFGAQNLNAVLEGSDNTAMGDGSLEKVTSGNSNTGFGSDALGNSTSGDFNTAVGSGALNDVLTGENNTSVGYNAGANVSTGSGNTYIGKNAGLLDVGSNNIYIGEGSGSSVASGNNNVILGSNTGNTISATSNNIIISDGSGNNRIQVDSGGDATFSGDVEIKNSVVPTLKLNNTDTSLGSQTLGSIEYYQNDASDQGVGAVSRINCVNESSFAGLGALTFETGNATSITERLRISSGGNVGIGDTSTIPELLYVSSISGDSRIGLNAPTDSDAEIKFSENNVVKYSIGHDAFTGNFVIGTANVDTPKLSISSVGNVTIGNSAAQDFYLALRGGVGGFFGWDDSANKTIVQAPNTRSLSFQVNSDTFGSGTEALTISSGGDVTLNQALSVIKGGGSSTGRFQVANHDTTSYMMITGNTYSPTPNTISFVTATNTALTISSGGKVIVGTDTTNALEVFSSGDTEIGFSYNTHGNIYAKIIGDITNASPLAGDIAFQTATGGTLTERMRITSGGTVLIGQTTANSNANGFGAYPSGSGGGFMLNCYNGAGGQALRVGTTSTGIVQLFIRDTTTVGSVSVNTSSTSFNTTSDYRLKENVTPITDAISRVNQLKPSRFNFIVDSDKIVDGFLAHEVQDIIPEAICGEKDAMKDEEYEVTPKVEEVLDEEGNVITEAVEAVMETRSVPDYQGIDQSKIVPLLTAAIQEQQTIIEDLKSRIETLEG